MFFVNLIALSAVLCLLYSVLRAIYNITFHPLAKLPGPRLFGAFHLPWFHHTLSGTAITRMRELHNEYGPVVRYEPNAVSFISAAAWTDIHARKPGRKPIFRDPLMFQPPPGHTPSILLGSEADHSKARKALSHAFTETALRDQEPIIQKHCDNLISRLFETVQESPKEPVNMVTWLNSVIFDILGDLSFGESFETLETGEYHPWMTTVMKSMELTSWFMCMNTYPGVSRAFFALMNMIPSVGREMKVHNAYNEEKVTARLQNTTDRQDFLSAIEKNNEKSGLTKAEIVSNCSDLILAGSQVGVALAGLLYLLLSNPGKMEILVDEILTAFPNRLAIDFQSMAKVTYLTACIQESLRLYDPAPSAIPYLAPAGGLDIDGVFVPGGYAVSVHPHAAFHSASNFTNPEDFAPERWLNVEDFATNNRSGFKPFGYGASACLGQKLAHAEIRTIVVKLLYHFDIRLTCGHDNWLDQKGFFVWRTPPLKVLLTKRCPQV